MLTQILGLLLRSLSILGNVTGVLQIINGQTANSAQDSFYLHTSGTVDVIVDDTASIITTAAANQATLTSQLDDIEVTLAAMTATLATLQTAAAPVTLPDDPPPNWASDISGSVADDVWNSVNTGSGSRAGDLVSWAGWLARNIDQAGLLPHESAPGFLLQSRWRDPNIDNTDDLLPEPAEANILPTDTLLSWLLREASDFDWVEGFLAPELVSAPTIVAGGQWIYNLTTVEFILFRDRLFSVPPAFTPPVWPGLANVTLGTPVALAAGVTIAEPMDGVLIAITAAPLKQGFFTFDDVLSYRNAGALAFFSDNGDEEFPQTLGFEQAVYCPRSIAHAAGVKVRTSDLFSGTITPFSITT